MNFDPKKAPTEARIMELLQAAESYPAVTFYLEPKAAFTDVALLLRELLERRNGSFLTQVREFHKTFGAFTKTDGPGIPADRGIVPLRAALIREEFEELMQAMGNADLIAIADAIADLHYVLSGTSLAYDIPEDAVFAEVHRSNMSKTDPDGTVHRRADGKILKSASWSPPRIAEVLEPKK